MAGIRADFAYSPPERKELLCADQDARLVDIRQGKSGPVKDCGGRDSQLFQLAKQTA